MRPPLNLVALSFVLQEERVKRGLTQAEIARLTGVSHKTISAWERGRNQPSVAALDRIAAAMDLRAADILTLTEAAG